MTSRKRKPPRARRSKSIRFAVRRARSSDREAILEMSKRIWGGHDYMPLVWDKWLAEKRGALLTATADGRPVGVSKVSLLAPGEVWLEGLRLHPDYQGLGLSKRIHRATFREAKRLNPKTVRYSTWIGNEASRRIAEKNGFWLIARTGWMWGRARPGKRLSSRPAKMDDLDAVVRFTLTSDSFARTNGVAGVGWTFPTLTRGRIRRLVSKGRVLVYPRRGVPRAVAVFDIGKVDDDVCLGFVDGSDENITRLAQDVLSIAADSGRSEASAMVPMGRVADLVYAAGFDEWQPVRAVVYELGARGLPATSEPLEDLLCRTLRSNESDVLDAVAELLAERAPAPLARENVRDFVSRHLIPDTDRILIASTQDFFVALPSDKLRTVFRAVIEHLHREHGLAGEAVSASPRVVRIRHRDRSLAVVRARGASLELTLGPGFGHCFSGGARFRVAETSFPPKSKNRKTGRHDSVTLTLTDRTHTEGARKAIDVIMKSAAKHG